jgi:hypothetical protein
VTRKAVKFCVVCCARGADGGALCGVCRKSLDRVENTNLALIEWAAKRARAFERRTWVALSRLEERSRGL